jgi:formylglycine-generating enzyme required for sulfatase activity
MVANTKDPRNGGRPYPWPPIDLKDVFPVNSRLSPLMQVRRGACVMGSSRGDERFPAESGRPAGPKLVALPTFFISQHEITVAQYRVCVAADKCPEPGKELGSDKQDHPVTGVSWHDAKTYVEWLQVELAGSAETSRELRRLLDLNWKIDLPSEEEWEKAARLDGAEFPWGNGANQRCANYNTDELRAVGSSNRCATYAYGLADMAGNVREWTRSLMFPYPYDAEKAEIPAAAGLRVVRGGSAKRIVPGAERVRAANREALDPNTADEFTGFRVVLVCKKERGCNPPESQ